METTADAVARAKRLVEAGQFTAAVPVLRDHLASYPEDAQAWHRLAGALIGAEDFPAAIAAADRALAIAPANGVAYRMRAIADLCLERWADLRDDAREAVRLGPEHVEALCLFGTGLVKADNDVAQARALLRRARKLDPRHPTVRSLQALVGPGRAGALLLVGMGLGVAGPALLGGFFAFSPSRPGQLERLLWCAIGALGVALPAVSIARRAGGPARPAGALAAVLGGAVAAGGCMWLVVGVAGQALAVTGFGLVLVLAFVLSWYARRWRHRPGNGPGRTT